MAAAQLRVPIVYFEQTFRAGPFSAHYPMYVDDDPAYEERCRVCHLGHARLLDAAHITADVDLDGIVHVTNGLALCKIHHTAYDQRLLGIDADYRVHINQELLDETDGPMLEHGLKEMHGERLRQLPRAEHDWPDRDRLAARFELFAA